MKKFILLLECTTKDLYYDEDSMTPEMPLDWDDHVGWDQYYQALPTDRLYTEIHYAISDGLRFTENLEPAKTFWIPGCGITLVPHVIAALGFAVWATDVSPTAIEMQKSVVSKIAVQDFISEADRPRLAPESAALHLLVHDFRQPFEAAKVDRILNIKAFQALPPASMKAAANVHYNALTEHGVAYFSTMNVQGERRDLIEDTLVEAGFLVPFYETNRWYRHALADTGIPHGFILGNPIVFRSDERYQGENADARIQEDQTTLRSFDEEYRTRKHQQLQEIQAYLESGTPVKIATVIYNTG